MQIESDDELELLSRQYEAEAARQLQEGLAKTQKKKPQNQASLRAEGLATALPPTNKGFKLLKAMGYQEGQGLGNRKQGMSEPLPLNLKTSRTGLGVDERKREREQQAAAQKQEEQVKRAKADEVSKAQFQQAQREDYQLRQLMAQLRNAWNAAEQLEERSTPARTCVPTPIQHSDDAGSLVVCEQSTAQDLDDLLSRQPGLQQLIVGHLELRPAQDEDHVSDGGAQPPGNEQAGTAADAVGGGSVAAVRNKVGSDALQSPVTVQLAEVQEQLRVLLGFLRGKHCYCLYCGCAYDSPEELLSVCPGMTEEEHG